MLRSLRLLPLLALPLLLGLLPARPPEDKAPEVPFTLPPGFVAERVAGPPLVEHPMMAGFDEQGRLYVSDSAGLNLRAAKLLEGPPSRVRLLEDTDGDGIFDKARTFADKMTFPMGALWHDGAFFCCAPPSLWKLQEKDGRLQRQELVTKFGFSGNAASIHGPFLGPDGRVYWTDGRHGHEIRTREGTLLQGKAARIFRCRPDGRDVEVVCGGGMDDPVEIAFTPEGEALATVDIFASQPRRVDAIIHCAEGAVFPYNPVYKEFKQTGPLLPPVVDLGWVAPVGLMRYRGEALGAGFRGNFFTCQFNTHKVRRHVPERAGATLRATTEEFLTSTHPDFHPTDILEDADGSLLVIDTGGWFRIGCPTSQIAKPEVKGAIYRIRRAGARTVEDPRGLKLRWDSLTPRRLAGLLDDPRPAVRDRAIARLAELGKAAVPTLAGVLKKGDSTRARRNAVWALCRIEDADAAAPLVEALADRDASVRQAATHAVGLNRIAGARSRLRELVRTDTPPIRARAADALGRLADKEAVPDLLVSLKTAEGPFLKHALIHALIVIGDAEGTRKGLKDDSPRVQRGALIALGQMEGGKLARAEVVPLLGSDDADLRAAALDAVQGHPGWAAEAVGLLRKEVTRPDPTREQREALATTLRELSGDAAVQKLLAGVVTDKSTPLSGKLLVLEVMANAPLKSLPRAWVRAVGECLSHEDPRLVGQALTTVRDRAIPDFDPELRRLAGDEKRPTDLRLAALAALAPRMKEVDAKAFALLRGRAGPDVPPLERLQAAGVLGSAPLSDRQLEALADTLAGAGALELPHLLGAYERSHSAGVGRKLVSALARAPGLEALSPGRLRQVLEKYPAEVRKEAGPLEARLGKSLAEQKTRLDELGTLLSGGNPVQGKTVFYGLKAACAACHTVAGRGGKIGPDLTKIATIRAPRDLLEALIFPSSSIVRGYEPYVVTTRKGRALSGILARETPEEILLITAERAEIRIARGEIESLTPSPTSIMPQGLDGQLTRRQLRDLLAYLQSLR